MNLKATDFPALKAFALEKEIDMIVVGPEDPLVQGIFDSFKEDPATCHIDIIGPTAKGATLEGSKEFAKGFMMRHNIPTARYKSITADNLQEGLDFLASLEAPYVLKADGLCAGKGVLILPTLEEAQKELKEMLDGMFGDASATVVIEEFLSVSAKATKASTPAVWAALLPYLLPTKHLWKKYAPASSNLP